MTGTSPSPASEADDQTEYLFRYGHARMPFFMKVIWVGFLAGATWYVVTFLLEALRADLAKGA